MRGPAPSALSVRACIRPFGAVLWSKTRMTPQGGHYPPRIRRVGPAGSLFQQVICTRCDKSFLSLSPILQGGWVESKIPGRQVASELVDRTSTTMASQIFRIVSQILGFRSDFFFSTAEGRDTGDVA